MVKLDVRDYDRIFLNAQEQKYLSGSNGLRKAVISNFLKSKLSNFNIEVRTLARFFDGRVIEDSQMQKIFDKVITALNEGKNVHLGITSIGGKIRLLGLDNVTPSYTTLTWNKGDGHAVFVTEVSSWGKRLLIPFTDLQNGAMFEMEAWKINGPIGDMTPLEIKITDAFIYACHMQYQKYGPEAANYIMNFLNTGNIFSITNEGEAKTVLKQFPFEQILDVVNNYVDIENILNLMGNDKFKNIELRRITHENATGDITNAYRLRVLTDLYIIRSGKNLDIAFEDLRLMFGNISNDDLLSRTCIVQTSLMSVSKHIVENYMGITLKIYDDGPKMAITTARVKNI